MKLPVSRISLLMALAQMCRAYDGRSAIISFQALVRNGSFARKEAAAGLRALPRWFCQLQWKIRGNWVDDMEIGLNDAKNATELKFYPSGVLRLMLNVFVAWSVLVNLVRSIGQKIALTSSFLLKNSRDLRHLFALGASMLFVALLVFGLFRDIISLKDSLEWLFPLVAHAAINRQ